MINKKGFLGWVMFVGLIAVIVYGIIIFINYYDLTQVADCLNRSKQ